MKKKALKIIAGVLCVIVVLWSATFITDLVRCNNLQIPVFAQAEELAEDGVSGEYKGLGYTVNVRMHENLEGEISPEYTEMKLFGILVSAVIV